MEKGNKKDTGKNVSSKISRKEAIKKAGYAAFSAATMMLLLNDPAKAQAGLTGDSSDGADTPDTWEQW